MNYADYNELRKTLPDKMVFLDDVSPYSLEPVVRAISKQTTYKVAELGEYHLLGNGVRELITTITDQFGMQGYRIFIPSDVYPVYYNLVSDKDRLYDYDTFCRSQLALPDDDNIVVLITNPIVPEGKYLPARVIQQLDNWLQQKGNRWLMIDSVYDLLNQSSTDQFKSDHVIILGSKSKLSLTPSCAGWAVTRSQLAGFVTTETTISYEVYASDLNLIYKNAWYKLADILIPIDTVWQPPQVGYISVIKKDYKTLHAENIAALPASVFGIKLPEFSVLSCLGQVKNDLL